jgi:sugar/nucleoside kinase (ribokinase family)
VSEEEWVEVLGEESWKYVVVRLGEGEVYVVPGARAARSQRGFWVGRTAEGDVVLSGSLRALAAQLIELCEYAQPERAEGIAKAVEAQRASVELWSEEELGKWLKERGVVLLKLSALVSSRAVSPSTGRCRRRSGCA